MAVSLICCVLQAYGVYTDIVSVAVLLLSALSVCLSFLPPCSERDREKKVPCTPAAHAGSVAWCKGHFVGLNVIDELG